MLKRKETTGIGIWAWIGGHLEYNKSVEKCAKRAVFVEIGLKIKNVKYFSFTTYLFS